MSMNQKAIYPGMPFDETVRQRIEKSYPGGTISFTHGRQDTLEKEKQYLVRLGYHSVVMPRMKYSASVTEAVRNEK